MFQLISDNSGFFSEATVRLSTVSMPKLVHKYLDYKYESCLFGDKDSDVVATYKTLAEAVIGHNRLSKQLGLKEV